MHFAKGSLELLSKDFKAYEFDCPCDQCAETLIEPSLVFKLQEFRDEIGFPVKIMSGYRCHSHQESLKAAGYETAQGTSQHELGLAVDVKTGHHTGEQLESVARAVGLMAVGRAPEWIHADMRTDKVRSWSYKC